MLIFKEGRTALLNVFVKGEGCGRKGGRGFAVMGVRS
jgi:hypothetical protein